MIEDSQILGDSEASAAGDMSQAVTHVVVIATPPMYDAAAIKAIRQQLDVTQRVLARLLGVAPKTVAAWENGRLEPTGSARRLLQILTITPEAFHESGVW